VRVGLLIAFPDFNAIQPMEMERVGRSFAETGTLANPYILPTGPTSHVLPLYPIVLGAIYRIWGAGERGQMAQHLWGCTVSALRCALIFPLALYLSAGRRAAWIAALAGVFYISAFATEIRGAWEAPLSALLLMGICYGAVRLVRSGRLTAGNALGYGMYVGVCALVSSPLLALSGAMGVAGLWAFRRRLGRFVVWAGACFLIVALMMLPWALRNRQQLGRTVWMRSNFGLEFWLAYHDGSTAGVQEADTSKPSPHPAYNPASAALVRQLGEIRYNDELKTEAWTWIQSHRAEAARLFVMHIVYFWFPPGNALVRLVRTGLTVLAAEVWDRLREGKRVPTRLAAG
jgi:hypothetical protein